VHDTVVYGAISDKDVSVISKVHFVIHMCQSSTALHLRSRIALHDCRTHLSVLRTLPEVEPWSVAPLTLKRCYTITF
jgi:hypothetical protein